MLDPRKPLHVVMRAVLGLSLRRGKVYAAIREALARVESSSLVRIVHVSIQRSHVHLIVESSQRKRLAHGMQGFQISAAKRINAALGRSGQVFADRYHAVPLGSPRQVRNTIAYVLNNWRHHREHEAPIAALWTRDPFSTAMQFDGWKEASGVAPPATYMPLPTRAPSTWLLRIGWRRHPPISFFEVPGGQVE